LLENAGVHRLVSVILHTPVHSVVDQSFRFHNVANKPYPPLLGHRRD
jgi:hypothetical protein